MKKIIALFALLALTLSIVACSNSNTNTLSCENCNAENVLGSKYCSSCGTSLETTINSSDNKKTIDLSEYNYSTYLTVSINMQSQNPTLISHNYHVVYVEGGADVIKSITPPSGSNIRSCSYISSNYSLNTTFSVKAYPKDSGYFFENASFTLVYRSSSSSFSNVTIHLDKNGAGTNTFMVTEEVKSASKNYSYVVSDLISSAKGTVSYVE